MALGSYVVYSRFGTHVGIGVIPDPIFPRQKPAELGTVDEATVVGFARKLEYGSILPEEVRLNGF